MRAHPLAPTPHPGPPAPPGVEHVLAATQEQLQRALYAARQAEANCELAHKRAEVLEMQAAFGLGAAFLGFAFGAMGFMYPRRRGGAA